MEDEVNKIVQEQGFGSLDGSVETKGEEKKGDVQGLDDTPLEGDVVLITQDGKCFTIPKRVASMSKVFDDALRNDDKATELPVPNVSGDIMDLIIQFMTHHDGVHPPIIEKPLRSKFIKEVVKDPWDATFIDQIGDVRQKLYDLILAANFMDCKSLLHLGCAKVASLIKGQPLDKVKEILDVNFNKAAKTEEAPKEAEPKETTKTKE